MLMRALHALRSALPEPPETAEARLDRRLADEPDQLAPLDEAMLEKLAEIDEREATDPAIHVVICGLRYEFVGSALHGLYNAVRAHGKSSRFNAGQLLIVRSDIAQMKGVLRLMVFSIFVLGVIELFGRDKGIELLMKLGERWLGI